MEDIDRTFDALLRPVLYVKHIRVWHDSRNSNNDVVECFYYEPGTNEGFLTRISCSEDILDLEEKYNVRVRFVR